MNLTKTVLKRPVTTVMVILCLIVFGLTSVFSSKLELIPSMDMPMLIVMATYPGASPDDVDQLVVQPIEDETGTLTGIKGVTSVSNENYGIVLLEYDYGTDIDSAYDDLKKKMDAIELPDDVKTPTIMEMNINDVASITLAVNNDAQNDLYNYVNDEVVPEFEKLSSVASVDISGGQKEYVKIELLPEKLNQYHLSMNAITAAVKSADFSYPVGSTQVGKQELSVSAGVDYSTMESLKKIPITVGGSNIIYLEDVANIYNAKEAASSIGRYNGRDTISVAIKKQQSSSDVEASKAVRKVVDRLMANDENLEIVVVDDNSDMIKSSLSSVMQTMVMAVAVSMIIIWLFFGDLKASLIVGTSIPISILTALVAMSAAGFSLNVITLSSLVLGVGMMVDNSIVVLESCFRSTKGVGFREYSKAALEGSGIVLESIIGGTITTCVVFIPLLMLNGMSGQLFTQLGYTIIFCMTASLFSAVIIVPLCYMFWHPVEKDHAPAGRIIKGIQGWYRKHMPHVIKRYALVFGTTAVLVVLSILMASRLNLELMSSIDEGIVTMTIKTKPGYSVSAIRDTVLDLENMVETDEDVDHYLMTYGNSGVSMTSGSDVTLNAYLKDKRKLSTDEVIEKWRYATQNYVDATITLEQGSSSMSSSMSSGDSIEVDLQSTDYDTLKKAADDLVTELRKREDVMQVHSSVENAAPVIKVNVDPVKAEAEGLTPASIGSMVYSNLSGVKAATISVNGNDQDVKVEFAPDRYDSIAKLQGMMITTATGNTLPLEDLAEIYYQDSPQEISRKEKQYQVSITMQAQADYKKTAEKDVKSFVQNWEFPYGVEMATNSLDESMGEELSALGMALVTAIFLIFIVMAIQFESPKFSLMVMATIPFSLIGSFGFLFLADCPISMNSMLGFLMLVGTVVNNGILYVDTVNQLRMEMPLDEALVEAGAIRVRPICMTTLTTIIAMIPNCLAFGKAGKMMQGLALVNVGGLVAATILTLVLLPSFYRVVYNMGKGKEDEYDKLDCD